MELIIIVALVAAVAIWYITTQNTKPTATASESQPAPYKVETPTLTEMAAKAEVVAETPAAPVVAAKPKAPAKRAAAIKAKPVAKKAKTSVASKSTAAKPKKA
jgi:hypothetical protein